MYDKGVIIALKQQYENGIISEEEYEEMYNQFSDNDRDNYQYQFPEHYGKEDQRH